MHRSALSVVLLKKLYFQSVMHRSAISVFFKKNAEDSGTEDTDLYDKVATNTSTAQFEKILAQSKKRI